jgi:RNA polymerase sigma factor for flagellar operon FliA
VIQASGSEADTSEEEFTLWQQFHQTREPRLRNKLIERYLPLARMVAATLFARRGSIELEFSEYLQAATVGLIEAVDRFDIGRQVHFAAFALPRIRGSVLNSLEGLSERYAQYRLRRRLAEEREASLREGRKLSEVDDLFSELADVAVGLALSYLLEDSGMLIPAESRDSYRHDFYQSVAHRELRDSIARLVDALPEKERTVVRYHYYQGLSFTEIAELLVLSKGRISQLHRQALQLLREAQMATGNLALNI